MSIEFPLRRKQTPFGLISDPKIPVMIRTLAGDRTYYFLIDTGADFAVAPRRVAEQLGLQWSTLPEIRVIGIEQGGVLARVGSLPLRLERIELTVRCFFLDTARAPFLLGRTDFLERFILTIDQTQHKIILTEHP